MTHTPTPWILSISKDVIRDSDNRNAVAVLHDGSTSYDNCVADAERIVACVNACEGMEDPAKEIKQLIFELDMAKVTNEINEKEIAALKARVAELETVMQDTIYEIDNKVEEIQTYDSAEASGACAIQSLVIKKLLHHAYPPKPQQ